METILFLLVSSIVIGSVSGYIAYRKYNISPNEKEQEEANIFDQRHNDLIQLRNKILSMDIDKFSDIYSNIYAAYKVKCRCDNVTEFIRLLETINNILDNNVRIPGYLLSSSVKEIYLDDWYLDTDHSLMDDTLSVTNRLQSLMLSIVEFMLISDKNSVMEENEVMLSGLIIDIYSLTEVFGKAGLLSSRYE